MLPYPNLNDQEVEEIITAALDQLRAEGGDWDSTGISDPGVFLLEIFAKLKCIQQSYINQVGAKSFYKFAALLGLKKEQTKAAKTYLSFSCDKSILLLEGTRLISEDLIFETTETIWVQPNRVTALGYQKELKIEIQKLDVDHAFIGYPLLPYEKGEGNSYLILEQLLPSEQPITFYFKLVKEEFERIPITKKEEFIPLSKVIWEYYGCSEDGQEGWHPIELLKDETFSFLFSGQVMIKIHGTHKKNQGKSLLRIRTITYGYEFEPRISGIWINCVSAVQCRTLCKTLRFSVKQLRENQMFLETALAIQDCYQLYICQKEQYLTAESLEITYLIKKIEGRFRLGTSNRSQLLERFSLHKPEETALLLVLYDKEFYTNRFLGSGTGISDQKMIPKVSGTILSDSLEILVGQTKGWESWSQVSSFDTVSAIDCVYTFSESKGEIIFGDNIHGKTPYIGENNICVTSCAVTAAKEGNVREGTINHWSYEKVEPSLQVEQILDAFGGREEETKESLKQRVRAQKKRQLRAVTTKDYEEIIKKTQGLKLSHVSVIPLYRPGLVGYPKVVEENAVTLILEAEHDPKLPFPKKSYLENVRRWLEPYRLLTTKVYFMMPQYFGLELDGELLVSGGYETAKKAVETVLKDYLLEGKEKQLGKVLSYGDLCGRLERLNCIDEVKYLQMQLSPSVHKNSLGDLFLPPYGRVYLKQNNLHFQKYTEGR